MPPPWLPASPSSHSYEVDGAFSLLEPDTWFPAFATQHSVCLGASREQRRSLL